MLIRPKKEKLNSQGRLLILRRHDMVRNWNIPNAVVTAMAPYLLQPEAQRPHPEFFRTVLSAAHSCTLPHSSPSVFSIPLPSIWLPRTSLLTASLQPRAAPRYDGGTIQSVTYTISLKKPTQRQKGRGSQLPEGLGVIQMLAPKVFPDFLLPGKSL